MSDQIYRVSEQFPFPKIGDSETVVLRKAGRIKSCASESDTRRAVFYLPGGLPISVNGRGELQRWSSCPGFNVLEEAIAEDDGKIFFPKIFVSALFDPSADMPLQLSDSYDNPFKFLHRSKGRAVSREHRLPEHICNKSRIGLENGDLYELELRYRQRDIGITVTGEEPSPGKAIAVEGSRFTLSRVRHKSFKEQCFSRFDDEGKGIVQVLTADLRYDNSFDRENCPFF